MYANTMTIEIQFGDCDPAGIVYYPNYFRFFDNAAAALISSALGMNKREWLDKLGSAGIPVVDTGAQFSRPARFGDRVDIRTEVTELGRSSVTLRHTLSHGGEPAVVAHDKRVWVVRTAEGGIRSAPIPDELRKALEGTS